jgi:metal-responsive CopG/Arc/MetJ family transcriptional regulator
MKVTGMKEIELTIEDSLLAEIDEVTRALSMTRADFVRTALERALGQREIIALERQHARGYAQHPMTSGEFSEWEAEHVEKDS